MHAKVGTNQQPLTKCDDFRRIIDERLRGEVDVAVLKFCYIDVEPTTDYAMLCDESYALRGIRAGGNRSGGVFRLAGTSAAAPQLGRHLARTVTGLAFPLPSKVPAPTDADEIRKRGQGNLEPP